MDIAKERGTFIVTVPFKDSTEAAVTPTDATWSLLNKDGGIVNDQEDESISPDTTVYIVLSGDDLDLADGQFRTVLVKWTYNSSTYGNGLQAYDEYTFEIEDLLGVE